MGRLGLKVENGVDGTMLGGYYTGVLGVNPSPSPECGGRYGQVQIFDAV